MTAVLDTHAAIWYLHPSSELSSAALQFVRRAVEGGEPVYVSVISLVETIYLVWLRTQSLLALASVTSYKAKRIGFYHINLTHHCEIQHSAHHSCANDGRSGIKRACRKYWRAWIPRLSQFSLTAASSSRLSRRIYSCS